MLITEAITEVVDYIDTLGLAADVTGDAIAGANAVTQGRVAIIVQPPRLVSLTKGNDEFEFQTVVAAGPFDQQGRATQRLAPIVKALFDSRLMPTAAEPNLLTGSDSRPYPCYVLTHTTQND